MSSMRGVALIRLARHVDGCVHANALSRAPAQTAAVAAPTYGYSVGYALNDWRRLRQSSGYTLRRLCPLPDRQSRLAGRNEAARLGREGDAPRRECRRSCSSFFSSKQPTTGNGCARLAEALSATGRNAEALAAARAAWASADLGAYDEQNILARYGRSFTVAGP